MSLIITSVSVAAGIAFGRWLARRASRKTIDASSEKTTSEVSTGAEADDGVPWDRFCCRLGDVVVHPSGDEAWLAGAIVLSEDVVAAVLFVAPEAKSDRAVYVRAKPESEIFWLAPLANVSTQSGTGGWGLAAADPPTALEIEGESFERIRRLPLRARRIGEGAPEVADEIILAEYKSLRSVEKRMISISGGGNVRAWAGTVVDVGTCDVLPAGTPSL